MYPPHNSSRYRVEIHPAAPALAREPRISLALSRRKGRRRWWVERAAFVLGALGIVGFVASNVGIATGFLGPAKYLALSVASIAQYAAALVLARSASRGAAWDASFVSVAGVLSVDADDARPRPSASATQ